MKIQIKIYHSAANLYGSAHLNYYLEDWIFGMEQIGSGSRYNDADNTVKNIGGYMITNLVTNYVFNEKFYSQYKTR